MRVVLVNPPLDSLTNQMDMPLGLLYLAAAIKENHEVLIVDSYSFHMSIEETTQLLIELNPDVVGVSLIFSKVCRNGLEVLKALKKAMPDVLTFAGGNTATMLRKSLLRNTELDYILLGESDLSFPVFIENLEKRKNMKGVPGIAYYDRNGSYVETVQLPPADLDLLPFPARDRLPHVEKYQMSFLSSRGCSYGCIYCSSSAYWGRSVRFRSAENILAEIDEQKSLCEGKFTIIDDCFTLNKKRALIIAEGIRNMFISPEWGCNARIEQVDESFIRKMASCGCTNMFFGAESGSEKVLKILHREYTAEDIIRVKDLCLSYHIVPDFSFMVGLPGETKEELQKTFGLIKRLRNCNVASHILTPFPGTAICENPDKYGIIIDEYEPDNMDINDGVRLHTEYLSRDDIQEAYRKEIGLIFQGIRHSPFLP